MSGTHLLVGIAVLVVFLVGAELLRWVRRQLGRLYRRVRYGNAATIGRE